MRPVQSEVRALVALLEQEDWGCTSDCPEDCEEVHLPSAEEVAKACIVALDKARGDRRTYVAVMQFGEAKPFYLGLGPYEGKKSAANAALAHPAAGEAFKIVVIPLLNAEGMATLLKAVG